MALSMLLLAAACSWSRFDDIENDPPVELLEQPDELRFGFGNSIAVAAEGDSVVALVTGIAPLSRGASFQIGRDESTATESSDRGYCESSGAARTCSLAMQPAGLGRALAPSGEERLCFAVGFGVAAGSAGVVVRCGNGVEFALPVPDGVDVPLGIPSVAIEAGEAVQQLVLATDADEAPSLLASSPSQARAWRYEPLTDVPEELTAPSTVGPAFGSSLAVAREPDARVYAVGDAEAGEVWLFRAATGEAAQPLGCLASAGLGRGLAAGPVDGAEGDELLLADDEGVLLVSGAALASVVPAPDAPCGFEWLPDGAVLAQASCQTNTATADCASSRFGAAVAVADLDGDGTGEVAVGAPNMSVRGESGAGAVLIYDFRTGGLNFVDTRILSSAESGDQLGASLATAPQRTRDVLIAGAPGRDRAAVLYCNALSPNGPRCR
jgi:hypothetical protein